MLVQHGLVTFSDKRRPGTADYTLEVSLEMQHGLVTFSDKRRPGTADYTLEVGFEVEYQKFFVWKKSVFYFLPVLFQEQRAMLWIRITADPDSTITLMRIRIQIFI